MTQFIFSSNPWLFPIVMLVVLGLSIELPHRLAKSLMSSNLVKDDAWNIVQAALLTLAAFVLGLSFSQASTRFDERRVLVVQEANAIGTTWLRANQLPATEAKRFRQVLFDYTADRLKAYETPGDPALYQRTIEQGARAQEELWSIASFALQVHQTNLGLSLLMQTLNDTIDVSSAQLQALTTHVPTAVIVLTLCLVTLGTLSIGFGFARDQSRPAVLSAIYVVACVVVIAMMVDYDRPQTGFVTINLNPLKLQLKAMTLPQESGPRR
jgi:hypothetical protein